MTTFIQREIHERGKPTREVFNQLSRADIVDLINALKINTPGGLIEPKGSTEEFFNLSPGSHGISPIKEEWLHISSVGAGTRCDKPLTVENNAIVEGIHFKGAALPLVEVKSKTTSPNTTVIFRSCIFDRTRLVKTPVWAEVEGGALVVFSNCVFRGGTHPNTGGTIISNGGAGAAVQVVGCVNTTGLTYSGVTFVSLGNISV